MSHPSERYPLVWVEWHDANQGNGWRSIPKPEVIAEYPPYTCTTVGWHLGDSKTEHMIVSTLSGSGEDDEACEHRFFIPKGMVVGWWEITLK